jgi:hypothetical protein
MSDADRCGDCPYVAYYHHWRCGRFEDRELVPVRHRLVRLAECLAAGDRPEKKP